jgi:tetratricopeptide (TPR) repeat protein
MPQKEKEPEKQTDEPDQSKKIGFKIPGFSIYYNNQLLSIEFPFFSSEIGVSYLASFFAFLIKIFQGIKNVIYRYKKTSLSLAISIIILSLIISGLSYKNAMDKQNAKIVLKCYRLGKLDDAEKTLSRLWFNKSLLLKAKIIALLYKGDLVRAETILKRIQTTYPHEPHQFVLEGHILFLKNRLDEAALLYSKVIQMPDTEGWLQSEALLGRSRIFSKNKDYPKALNDLNKALDIDPEFVMAYTHKGLVFEKQNKLIRAMKQYLEAMHMIKKNTSSQTKNAFYLINNALYKKVKVLADCDLSDSCKIKLEAQTEDIIRQKFQSKDESTSKKFFFCPLEIQGQNEYLPGESLYYSDIILEKLETSHFSKVDPLSIYGLMKRFQKPVYMASQTQIASKLTKYLSTDFIISGKILRKNTSIQISLSATDTSTDQKTISKTATLDKTKSIKSEIETFTLNFLREL